MLDRIFGGLSLTSRSLIHPCPCQFWIRDEYRSPTFASIQLRPNRGETYPLGNLHGFCNVNPLAPLVPTIASAPASGFGSWPSSPSYDSTTFLPRCENGEMPTVLRRTPRISPAHIPCFLASPWKVKGRLIAYSNQNIRRRHSEFDNCLRYAE